MTSHERSEAKHRSSGPSAEREPESDPDGIQKPLLPPLRRVLPVARGFLLWGRRDG